MTDSNSNTDTDTEPDDSTDAPSEEQSTAKAVADAITAHSSDAKDVGREFGYGLGLIGVAAGSALWKTGEGVLIGVTRVLPGGSKFWQNWIKIGYGNLKRTSGADRINHVMKQGHILHRPIYWNSAFDRWETKDGGNWWNGGKQHLYTGPGGVPCSWGASRATELGNQVQAEVGEALELGAEQDLYASAQVHIQQMTVDAQGGGRARADGGSPVLSDTVTVRNPGILEDQLVNLDGLYADDASDDLATGRLVSMENYYETYPETVDSEEMQKQEDRGLLADMNDGDTWKIALYFMAAALLFVLAWEYLPSLLGSGGGGGGGGLMPF